MLRIGGRSLSGQSKAITTNENGNLVVEVKDREGAILLNKESNRLSTSIFNDVNFGGNDKYGGSTAERLDISQYQKLNIKVENNHDINVICQIYMYESGGTGYGSSENLIKEFVLEPGQHLKVLSEGNSYYKTSHPFTLIRFLKEKSAEVASKGNVRALIQEYLEKKIEQNKIIGQTIKGRSKEAISFEEDSNNLPVIRMINAAPFAYDELLDQLKTETVGRREIARTNAKVKTGEELIIFGDLKVEKYRSFQLTVKSTGSHVFEVYIRNIQLPPNGLGESLGSSELITPESYMGWYYMMEEPMNFKSVGARFSIKNLDDEDRDYDVILVGVY